MKKIILLFSAFFLLAATSRAQSTSEFFTQADAFFKTYVKNGRVAYASIKKNPTALNELTNMAKTISVSKDNAKEYQAFWINGYNLLVIQNIVENYPLKSPLDVKGFFDKKKQDIGGKQIVLNDIENKLLRGNFPSEARFHFVLVCAGLGCPPIINAAYKPDALEAQLQKQTTLALNNPSFIKVSGSKVKISQIFEWYKGDFTKDGQTLAGYIDQYRKEKLPQNAKVSFYPYDWTLNETK